MVKKLKNIIKRLFSIGRRTGGEYILANRIENLEKIVSELSKVAVLKRSSEADQGVDENLQNVLNSLLASNNEIDRMISIVENTAAKVAGIEASLASHKVLLEQLKNGIER